MTTYIICSDRKIKLSEQEVEKLRTVPFFKEVAQLGVGDTLDLNITEADFDQIFRSDIQLRSNNVLRILRHAIFFQIENCIHHCHKFIHELYKQSFWNWDVNDIMLLCFSEKLGQTISASAEFRLCCEYGHLDLAQVIWYYNRDIINIHDDENYFFRISCDKGYLELAKWLYRLDEFTNIHYMHEYAFRFSCAHGHLEVAQWLYSLDREVMYFEKYKRDAYRYSYRYLEVAQWVSIFGEFH